MTAMGGKLPLEMAMVVAMQPSTFEIKCRRAMRGVIWISGAITLVAASLGLAAASGTFGQRSDALLCGQIALIGLLVLVGNLLAKRFFLP